MNMLNDETFETAEEAVKALCKLIDPAIAQTAEAIIFKGSIHIIVGNDALLVLSFDD